MSSAHQEEFLFGDGAASQPATADALDPLLRDIGRAWGLPIGARVRVSFRDGENFPELVGRLEVAAMPDLPFARRAPLRLRLNGYEFLHTAIARCVAMDT